MHILSKSSRDIPKTIAAFGEKQFKETGAMAVEVLRVKNVVMRKYFRQLRGIVFLVAIVSLDRVRVYFFNAAGIMVIGENLDQSTYEKIRKSSKLVAKFEKPKVLTPEELRIEATQELRDALGKAIRRVSRFIAVKEPSFPDIFVTKSKLQEISQNFGLQITEKRELLFEETALSQKWVDGLLLRAAYLIHLEIPHSNYEAASSIGNAIGLSLLKDSIRQTWLGEWKKRSKGTEWMPLVNHFFKHYSTYTPESYSWIRSVLNDVSEGMNQDQWRNVLSTIHDALVIPLTTEDYHVINGFCKTLTNPKQLDRRRYLLEQVHLAPRLFFDPSPLGVTTHVFESVTPTHDAWAQVGYISGNSLRYLEIGSSGTEELVSIDYWLNLEDIYPSAGSPFSHGRDIIHRALEKIGIMKPIDGTFETSISMSSSRSIDTKERAVLERLVLGNLEILENTIVGSPMVLNSLFQNGCITYIPEFYHLGINQEFLLHGPYDVIHDITRNSLETTIFRTQKEAYGIISVPTSWRDSMISSIAANSIDVYPIVFINSPRRILRDEVVFEHTDDIVIWSAKSS